MQVVNEVLKINEEYGTLVTSEFKTSIVLDGAEREQRFIAWQSPRLKYKIFKTILLDSDREYLTNFHNSVKGQARGFLFRDWSDYKAEVRSQSEVCSWGQLHHISGDDYQLVKVYQINENCVHYRVITRPDPDTVIIYGDTGETITNWTIDETTGVISSSAPLHLCTSAFSFFVPVRFAQDEINYKLQAHKDGIDIYSLEQLELIEVREGSRLQIFDKIPDKIETQFLLDALLKGDTKPTYQTEVTDLESGYTDTVSRLLTPKFKWRLGSRIFPVKRELEYLLTWWRCCKGRGLTFPMADEKEFLHEMARFDADELTIKIESGTEAGVLISSFDGIELTSVEECPPVEFREASDEAPPDIFLSKAESYIASEDTVSGGGGGDGSSNASVRFSSAFIVQAIEEKSQEIACISTPTWKRVNDGGTTKCLRVCDGTGSYNSLQDCIYVPPVGVNFANQAEAIAAVNNNAYINEGLIAEGVGLLTSSNPINIVFTQPLEGLFYVMIVRAAVTGEITEHYDSGDELFSNDPPRPFFVTYNPLGQVIATNSMYSGYYVGGSLNSGSAGTNTTMYSKRPSEQYWSPYSANTIPTVGAFGDFFSVDTGDIYRTIRTRNSVPTTGGFNIDIKYYKISKPSGTTQNYQQKLNKKAKVFYLAAPQVKQKITEIHETEPVFTYLSAAPDGILGTIKKGKENNQFKKIQTFKYDTSNLDINSGAYTSSEWTNPNPPTTNQNDWRRSSSHSYSLFPPNDPNSCIQQRMGNILTNIWEEDFSLTLGVNLNSLLFSDTLTQIVIDRLLEINGSCSISNTVSKNIQIPKLINPQSAYAYLLSLSPDKLSVLAATIFPI